MSSSPPVHPLPHLGSDGVHDECLHCGPGPGCRSVHARPHLLQRQRSVWRDRLPRDPVSAINHPLVNLVAVCAGSRHAPHLSVAEEQVGGDALDAKARRDRWARGGVDVSQDDVVHVSHLLRKLLPTVLSRLAVRVFAAAEAHEPAGMWRGAAQVSGVGGGWGGGGPAPSRRCLGLTIALWFAPWPLGSAFRSCCRSGCGTA
jgi:hypothetical protein